MLQLDQTADLHVELPVSLHRLEILGIQFEKLLYGGLIFHVFGVDVLGFFSSGLHTKFALRLVLS